MSQIHENPIFEDQNSSFGDLQQISLETEQQNNFDQTVPTHLHKDGQIQFQSKDFQNENNQQISKRSALSTKNHETYRSYKTPIGSLDNFQSCLNLNKTSSLSNHDSIVQNDKIGPIEQQSVESISFSKRESGNDSLDIQNDQSPTKRKSSRRIKQNKFQPIKILDQQFSNNQHQKSKFNQDNTNINASSNQSQQDENPSFAQEQNSRQELNNSQMILKKEQLQIQNFIAMNHRTSSDDDADIITDSEFQDQNEEEEEEQEQELNENLMSSVEGSFDDRMNRDSVIKRLIRNKIFVQDIPQQMRQQTNSQEKPPLEKQKTKELRIITEHSKSKKSSKTDYLSLSLVQQVKSAKIEEIVSDYKTANVQDSDQKQIANRSQQTDDLPEGDPINEEDKYLDAVHQQIMQDSEPFWLSELYVNRPILVMIIGGAIIAVFCAVCVIMKTYQPSPITIRDLIDYSDDNTVKFDTREAAQIEIQTKSSPTGEIPLQSVTREDVWLNIAIECDKKPDGSSCDNIMTPEGVRLLQDIDDIIQQDPNWSSFCIFDSPDNQTCADNPMIGGKIAKVSPLNLFKVAYKEFKAEDVTQFAIDLAFYGLSKMPQYFNYTAPLFSTEYSINNRKAKMARMLLVVAGPINYNGIRYKNFGDRWSDQEYYLANWQLDLNEKLQDLQKKKYPGYQISSFGRAYAYRYFYRQLVLDLLWAFLSFTLVYLVVLADTRSFFVTSTTLGLIVLSFPCTLVIYKNIFGITCVSAMHLMIVFVVLGISADSIFVVIECWRQADSLPQIKGNFNRRMAFVWRRSAKSLLVTSGANTFGMLSNTNSSLMPITSFGYFAFIVIPINYVFIIFYFPACMMFYELYVREKEEYIGENILSFNAFSKCFKSIRNCSAIKKLCLKFLQDDKRKSNEIDMQSLNSLRNQGLQDGRSQRSQAHENENISHLYRSTGTFTKHGDIEDGVKSPNWNEFSYQDQENNDQEFPKTQMVKKNSSKIRTALSEKLPSGMNIRRFLKNLEGGQREINKQIQIIEQKDSESSVSNSSEYVYNGPIKENFMNKNSTISQISSNLYKIKAERSALQDNQKQIQSKIVEQNFQDSPEIKINGISQTQEDLMFPQKQSQKHKNKQKKVGDSLNISQSKYNRSVSRKSYKTAKRSQISKTSNSSVAISTKSWKEEANEDIEEHGNLEHYFGGKHTDFILKYRWIIVAVLTCMTGFSVYLCTNIHGLTKMELYFSERHPLYTAFNKAVYGFQKGVQSQSLVVDLMWGVLDIDRTGTDRFNASQIGKTVWDNTFDLSSPQAQVAVLNLCQKLKQKNDMLFTGDDQSVVCWIEDFKKYLNKIGLIYPLFLPNYEKYRFQTQKDYFNFMVKTYTENTKIGREQRNQNQIGLIDNKLVFMKFTAKSSGDLYAPFAQKNPYKLKWDDFINDFNALNIEGVNKVQQTAGVDWCIMVTEIQLVDNCLQQLWQALLQAIVALFVSAQNIFIAFYASITIISIMINVLAIIPIFGWELGSAESVGVVVCVGFAVDYVVHLASHYVISKQKTRELRIREALREMGVSVLFGGITTFLSASVLFVCVVKIFNKFASFVVATVTLSVTFGLFYFPALVAVAGPNGTFGNFSAIKDWFVDKIKNFVYNKTDSQDILGQNTQQDTQPKSPRSPNSLRIVLANLTSPAQENEQNQINQEKRQSKIQNNDLAFGKGNEQKLKSRHNLKQVLKSPKRDVSQNSYASPMSQIYVKELKKEINHKSQNK